MLRHFTTATLVAAALAQNSSIPARPSTPPSVCSALVYRAGQQECGSGYMLADIDTLTSCAGFVCENMMGPWSIAHGKDMTKKLAGSGYGCGIKDWDGTGVADVVCMPIPVTECSALTYKAGQQECGSGYMLADIDTLTSCAGFVCDNLMKPWSIAHGKDMTKKLAGSGYGCGIMDWDGTGVTDVVCMPIPVTKCSALTYKAGQQECGSGYMLADIDTLTSCAGFVCENMMGPWSIAHGKDMTKKLAGSGYGCGIMDWDGTGVTDVVCMPIPVPPPVAACNTLTYRAEEQECSNGQTLVDINTLTACADYICDNMMGPWSVAHGSDMMKKLAGPSYGCAVQNWDMGKGTGIGDVVCMPGNTPPAPTPTRRCDNLQAAKFVCPPGTQLAGLESLEECSDVICNTVLGEYAIAHGSDMTKKLAGSGYGCVVEDWDGTGVGDVICEPLSGVCNSLNYRNEECPAGEVLADPKVVKVCSTYICTELLAPTYMAHGSDKTKMLVGSAYGCIIEDWSGGNVGSICIPATTAKQ